MSDEWTVVCSGLARRTVNPIRQLVEELRLCPNPDKNMIALSIGDPTIFGNLKPAKEVTDAMRDSIDSYRYNGYGPSAGHQEAREAVAEYSSNEEYTVSPEDVILCSGCSCALDLCIMAVADPGQNILVPRPGFSIYRTLAEGLGIKCKSYNLKPEQGWEVDLEDLESQVDENTMALVVNNPSNPCGSVYSKKHLSAIAKFALRHKLPVIADEIYEHLVFRGYTFHPMAAVNKDLPVLSCSGLTKRFLIPGWRMGWIIVHNRHGVLTDVQKGLGRLNQRIIGSSTIVQGALPRILSETPQEFFDHTIDVIQRHAEVAYSVLSEIEGLNPIMPQGAMYMMVGVDMNKFPGFDNDLAFVQKMVAEESVFCLPGKCFDLAGFVRLVLTVPEEQLVEACIRIESFCRRHMKSEAGSELCSVGATRRGVAGWRGPGHAQPPPASS